MMKRLVGNFAIVLGVSGLFVACGGERTYDHMDEIPKTLPAYKPVNKDGTCAKLFTNQRNALVGRAHALIAAMKAEAEATGPAVELQTVQELKADVVAFLETYNGVECDARVGDCQAFGDGSQSICAIGGGEAKRITNAELQSYGASLEAYVQAHAATEAAPGSSEAATPEEAPASSPAVTE